MVFSCDEGAKKPDIAILVNWEMEGTIVAILENKEVILSGFFEESVERLPSSFIRLLRWMTE